MTAHAPAAMEATLLAHARAARGFMPHDEGLALHRAGLAAAPLGPLVEIGSYCGQSAIYLGAAARACGTILFSVDHHRGSEENQPGEQYHDPAVLDPRTGRNDSLPHFRRTIEDAGLEDTVVAVVGPSRTVATVWRTPIALLFVDGGHSEQAAQDDVDGWSPHIVPGGLLVFHDIFPDPRDGGQAPHRVYRRTVAAGRFVETEVCGSLRILQRRDG